MISFKDLALRRGTDLLFQRATLTIHRGEKIGVVGRNGSGKSSLFALLQGEFTPDAGDLGIPPRLDLAHLAQEVPAVPRRAIDYVVDGDTRLREVEAALAAAERAGDGERLGALHAELESAGGYTARTRAARLLRGLGFAEAEVERPVERFSGGWRSRLNLARTLMRPSDLLLLDEPTNHLDLDAVVWLERWLEAYPGTLLLISHDRDFLDNVVGRVLHIANRELTSYAGNYSAFEQAHAADLARQHAMRARQEREIGDIKRFVDRFRAKATKARQAQSRLKALARMERISPAHVDTPFRFRLPEPARLPDPLLELTGAATGYDGKPVLEGINLVISPGTRLGLVGPNGAGKSTLIKLLAGALPATGGTRETDLGTEIGYFAQHQLEQLDLGASPFVHLRRLRPDAPEQTIRDFLGGFDFGGDRAGARCETFSGGEKARLVLARLVWQAPNLLLLDEPTNHLDLEMRHALVVALQAFAGAVVLVSHDRHLLRTTADELLLVDDGTVRRFDGDVDDYRNRLAAPVAAPPRAAPDRPGPARGKDERRRTARERERRHPLVSRARRLEETLARLEARREALDAVLADPEIYAEEHKGKLSEHLFDRARVAQGIEQIEAEWLDLQHELEQMGAEID